MITAIVGLCTAFNAGPGGTLRDSSMRSSSKVAPEPEALLMFAAQPLTVNLESNKTAKPVETSENA